MLSSGRPSVCHTGELVKTVEVIGSCNFHHRVVVIDLSVSTSLIADNDITGPCSASLKLYLFFCCRS